MNGFQFANIALIMCWSKKCFSNRGEPLVKIHWYFDGGLWSYFYNLKPFSWQTQGEVYFSQHATLGRRNGVFLKADLTCGWALFHMFPIRDARESRYSMATLLSFSVVRWNNGAFVVTSAALFTFGDPPERSCQRGCTPG